MEEKIGSMLITAKGLRNLANAMDILQTKPVIDLSLWKNNDKIYFQLVKGSGAIKLDT